MERDWILDVDESSQKGLKLNVIDAIVDGFATFVLETHADGILPVGVTKEWLLNGLEHPYNVYRQTKSLPRLFKALFLQWRAKSDGLEYNADRNRNKLVQCVIEAGPKQTEKAREMLTDLLANPDLDPYLAKACKYVVWEIQANERVRSNVTRYELALVVFLSRPYRLTTMEELTPIFGGDPNKAAQAVRNLITRLNEKLEPYNVQIQHIPAYQLLPMNSR
jgi:hypothetical protein